MQITIIGLGLIGSSIGLSLKQSNWQELKIVGYARRSEIGSIAINSGVIDKAETTLREAVKSANVVIIATPVLTIGNIFSQIAVDLPHGSVVTDTASTKLQVMQWAEELLPPEISFIGGHPMAGKETFGIKAAKSDLFYNCTYCLTPSPKATSAAVQTVTDIVKKLGAMPLTIDAKEHDNLVAGISHLPLLLSTALVSVTTQDSSWEQMSQLASTGYQDLTRLASGNPEVNAHICLSNREAIVSWIDEFSRELQRLGNLIGSGGNEIEEALAIANKAREKWLEKRC